MRDNRGVTRGRMVREAEEGRRPAEDKGQDQGHAERDEEESGAGLSLAAAQQGRRDRGKHVKDVLRNDGGSYS